MPYLRGMVALNMGKHELIPVGSSICENYYVFNKYDVL